MTENKVTTVLKYVFIVLILAIIYFPVFSMIFFSFNANKSFTRFGGFSFKWYIELFSHKQMMNAVLVTISCRSINNNFNNHWNLGRNFTFKTKKSHKKLNSKCDKHSIWTQKLLPQFHYLFYLACFISQVDMQLWS